MKNHHNDTPKSSDYDQPRLIDNITQGIDKEGQLEPAVRFNQVIQSTLHRFPDYINRDKKPDRSESFSSKLGLTIPQEGKPPLSVHIESTIFADNKTKRQISVQEWREDGTPAAFQRYYQKGDDVLQCDVDDMSKRASLLSGPESEISEQVIDQPVGIDEINKLAELLESAKPVKSY